MRLARVRVAIVSVGTEVTSGEITDTNAASLARMASEAGAEVIFHAAVPDDLQQMETLFRACLQQADLTVSSGGLGPTEDDITREAMAQAAGCTLVSDPTVERSLREHSMRAGRPMPEENLRQARYPVGGRLLANLGGTAPGVFYQDPTTGHRVILLPGPPREMHPMAESYVRPLLERDLPQEIEGRLLHTERRIVRIVGVGESQVDEWLAGLMSDANPSLRPYAKEGEVHLRLVARAGSRAEATSRVEGVVRKIREILGPAVYGVGDAEDLERVCLEALWHKGETVALAESLTAGGTAARLASVPGASRALLGGVVAYQDAVKRDQLDVAASVLDSEGPVSRRTAEAMADGVRHRFGSDWGLSMTGWAGPDAPAGETVGDVWFGLAGPGRVEAVRRHFGLPRNVVRQHAGTVALDLLRRAVLGLPIPATADPLEAVKGTRARL